MLDSIYTITLHDALVIDPTLLDVITNEGLTNLNDEYLRQAIIARWDIYELSGETLQESKLFLKRKFEQFAKYYDNLLGVYNTEIDWKKGIKYHETIEDSTNRESTTTPGVTSTMQSFDLPRSASTENRPSSKTVSTPTGDNEFSEDIGFDRTRDTYKGDELEQRKKALMEVRNLYQEFAEVFAPCFIGLFS